MKFKVEGLRVEIQPPKDVTLKKATLALCKFRCECGLETLSIEKGDVRQAGSAEHRDGRPIPAIFDMLKEAYELCKEWNSVHDKAKDFPGYFRAVFMFHAKHRLSTMGSGGGETNLTVECPTCERRYVFSVSIENPLDPAEEVTLLKAYRKWGLANTEEVQRLLARFIAKEGWKHDPPLETLAEYIRYLACLDKDAQFVTEFVAAIESAIDGFQPAETDRTKSWVEDLKNSLKELCEDFAKESEDVLRKELEYVADLLKPPGYDFRSAFGR